LCHDGKRFSPFPTTHSTSVNLLLAVNSVSHYNESEIYVATTCFLSLLAESTALTTADIKAAMHAVTFVVRWLNIVYFTI
jgi:hypothetical protein